MFFTGQEQHQVASTKSQFLIGCYCSQASCSCILLRPKCDSLSCCRKLSRPAATAGFKAYNSAAAALRRHATLEPCPIGGCAEPRRELFEPSAAPRRESRSCEAARTPKPQQNPIEEHSKFPENSLRPSECPESQKEERERSARPASAITGFQAWSQKPSDMWPRKPGVWCRDLCSAEASKSLEVGSQLSHWQSFPLPGTLGHGPCRKRQKYWTIRPVLSRASACDCDAGRSILQGGTEKLKTSLFKKQRFTSVPFALEMNFQMCS